jgi:hypothetical protein
VSASGSGVVAPTAAAVGAVPPVGTQGMPSPFGADGADSGSDGPGGGAGAARGEADIAGGTPEALPGFSDEDMARLEAQTGNPFVDLARGNVAWGNFLTDATWSLLNVSMAVAAFLLSAIVLWGMFRRRDLLPVGAAEARKDAKTKMNRPLFVLQLPADAAEARKNRAAFMDVSISVVGLFVFMFTFILLLGSQEPQPLTWVNKWTPMTIALLAGQVALAPVGKVIDRRVEKREKGTSETHPQKQLAH